MGTEDNKTFKGLRIFGSSLLKKAVEAHKNAVAADTEAPTVGSRQLKIVSTTPDTLSIVWEMASDNVTANQNIRYEVFIAECDNSNDPWHKVGEENGITSFTFTCLKPNTNYAFYVKAYDEKGNALQYPLDNGCMTGSTSASNSTIQEDKVAPVSPSTVIKGSNITSTSIALSWNAATDNQTPSSQIVYTVYQSRIINGVAEGWKIIKTGAGITSHIATGLSSNTRYGFLVLVSDKAGNKIWYPSSGSQQFVTAAVGGNQNSNSSSDADRRAKIRQGFLDYGNSGKEKNVVLEFDSDPRHDEILPVAGGACLITTRKVTMDSTPRGELFPENDHFVFPGCLVYADEYLAKGTPRQVNFGKSKNFGSVRLSADFITSSNQKVVVPNDTSAEVKDGIAQIMRNSFGSEYKPSSQYSVNEEIYSDTKKMAVEANCSIDFLVKCDVKTKTTTSSEKIYKMHKISQQFYKITAEIENGDVSSLFGADVTWEDIKRQIDLNGPIAIIKEVTYGRYGYFFDEYEKSTLNFVGSQEVSYKKQSLDLKQDIDNVSSANRRWGYVYGGSAETAAKALSNYDAFASSFNSNPVVGPGNQARPISYTVIFLSSNRPCRKVNAGEYYDTIYRFCPNRIQTNIYNGAMVPGGGQLYVDLWYDTFKLINNVVTPYRSQIKWNHKWTERGRHQEAITLPQGEYFMPTAGIRITHKHGGGKAFDSITTSSGYIDISNGVLPLSIGGSAYKYQQDPFFKDGEGLKNLIM